MYIGAKNTKLSSMIRITQKIRVDSISRRRRTVQKQSVTEIDRISNLVILSQILMNPVSTWLKTESPQAIFFYFPKCLRTVCKGKTALITIQFKKIACGAHSNQPCVHLQCFSQDIIENQPRSGRKFLTHLSGISLILMQPIHLSGTTHLSGILKVLRCHSLKRDPA